MWHIREKECRSESKKMASNTTHVKFLLVGDGGVGKTTFIIKLRTGEFRPQYVATLGVEVHPIRFDVYTPFGNCEVCYNAWDTAGQEKFGGLRDGYYIMGGCAIVMFDFTHKGSIASISKWVRDLRKVCGGIPIVIVGNKRELVEDSESVCEEIVERMEEEELDVLGVVSMSVKEETNLYNLHNPFRMLIRHLLGGGAEIISDDGEEIISDEDEEMV